ncbi:mxaJ protein [Methylohalomonas lacus]|uniref:MxaJ protein n=1 Tax=Methylohalomonas lacus TaxID=398773 RepID=A0AAE3HHV4_9GAMM|nr:methanol oxidation system protein MoxJ [Methylohalomonas lacus]MCS3902150.1 mxaJ protein [Methylohalomonas lacus]
MNKLLSLLIAVPLSMATPVIAQAESETLRVCAAEDEMPYSNSSGDGFENEVAKVIADELDWKVDFVWLDRAAIFLVKDLLEPGNCDVVMGLDADDPRVLTSDPYYKSSYVFVYRKDSGLTIKDWESPDLKKVQNFAITAHSPAEAALREIGKYESNLNYMYSLIGYKSRRNEYVRYEPAKMISEVINGNAGVAIIWGPSAGRYVKNSSVPLEVQPVPDYQTGEGENIRFTYEQSLAVRKNDIDLMKKLNRALEQARPQIHKVLKAEGVPLVKDGELQTANKLESK